MGESPLREGGAKPVFYFSPPPRGGWRKAPGGVLRASPKAENEFVMGNHRLPPLPASPIISSMNPILPLLAAESSASSQKAGVGLIVLVFAIVLVIAVRATVRHLRGGGGCCGGAAEPPPSPDKQIGAVVDEVELVLDGLHCMKCVARVKAALEAIPGVAAEVTLEPQNQLTPGYGLAVVRMDREVPEGDLRKAVEDQGFRVVSIS